MTHLPNAISFGRLLAVPVVVFLLLNNMMVLAFWVFIAASFSDALDGYLARKFSFQTKLGIYLDPIADKILLLSVFIVLHMLGNISFLLFLLVILREVFIFLGLIHIKILKKKAFVTPMFVSKLNTVLQMFLLTLILAKLAFHTEVQNSFLLILEYSVMITTLLSWGGYGKRWLKIVQQK